MSEPTQEEGPTQGEKNIGTAEIMEDGTIHLFLIAEADDGTHGEAMIVVSPQEARYQSIRDHLGDIKPGAPEYVKPFPPSELAPPPP